MRRPLVAITGLLSVLLTLLSAPSAHAVNSPQPRLVAATPVDWTPAVNNGAVRAIAQVGSTIVLGGTFTSVTPTGSTTVVPRSYVVAFDAGTGVLRSFAPTLDGPVDAIVGSADGQSVYLGGEFKTVNGAKAKSLTRLSLSTGTAVSTFKTVAMNGNVLDLRLVGSRLYVGGNFSRIAGVDQAALATVDAATGKYDPFGQVAFAGTHNGGTTAMQKFDVTADGSRLLAIGNFSTVGGAPHAQVAMLDLTGSSATVANWGTTFYTGRCASVFESYLRDLDISPDGRYAVISTTGAYGGSTSPCDSTARFELSSTGQSQSPTWVNYTGGDTTYAVAVTGTTVYVGGHFRWQNNAFSADRAGAGSVAREGIAALDPKNGLPLDWNPGRARGVGVFDMLATPQGLWVGSDTDRIGGWGVHPKIAFFPLAGGHPVLPTSTPALPGQVYLAGNTGTTNSNVLYRVNAAGPALAALDGGPDWAGDTGATSPYRNASSNVATSGSGTTTSGSVPDSTPNAIFDSERWDPAGGEEMQWTFPVPTGTHLQVRLYFANRCSCTSAVGQRRFTVALDGVVKLSNYDIVADVGDQTGTMKAFDVTSDGMVNIGFTHLVENPLINGIEIINRDVVLAGTPNDITTRSFDGTLAGGTSTLPDTGIAWSRARGAFYLNGTAYTGWSDGNLYARPFDGSTFGTAVSVSGMDDVAPLTAFHNDVQNTTAMFFDSSQNRLYFTLAGVNALYYRGFTPSTNVVGGIRYPAANTSGLDFSKASAMLVSGSTLYVGDRSTGNLAKVGFSGGTVSGAPAVVSGPGVDGQAWYARAVFVAPAPGAPNDPPDAAFTSACLGSDCAFDASTSTDPDGAITSYTWTFGDGATAASSAPVHTYTQTGRYDVTLTVTDDGGDSSRVTHPVTVTSANQPPVVTFSSGCTALDCTFDGSGSVDPDGDITAYGWTFGDGTTSTDAAPQHTYGSPGSYSVTLKVTDTVGAVDTLTRQVTVGAQAAAVRFVGSDAATLNAKRVTVAVPGSTEPGDAMVLIATSANATTAITPPPGWTEVDATSGTGVQTRIWQRVADPASAGSVLAVNQADLTKLAVTLAVYSGTSATTPVGAHALSSQSGASATHTTPPVTTSLTGAWLVSYWADVSADSTLWALPAGQTGRSGVAGTGGGHVSSALSDLGGPLTIGTVGGHTATARSATGPSTSGRATMATLVLVPAGQEVPNQPPTAAFTSGCTALSCTFDGTGSTDPDGALIGYAWTFGDGGTADIAAPQHRYSTAGVYSVTLKVTDARGAVDTLARQVTVTAAAAGIGFVGADAGAANAKKVTVTVPGSVLAGQALVLLATSANPTTSLTAPAGWAEVQSVTSATIQTKAWQRVADATSAASTVAVTQADLAKATVTVAAYSGTAGTPVVAQAGAAQVGVSTQHTTPTLTTSATGGWLVSYWADVSSETAAWTAPAGHTSRASAFGAAGGHVSSLLTDLGGPLTTGTVGGYTATASAASGKATMLTLVLAAS